MESTYANLKGISVGRIAILGMFLALMIGVKFIFGFVPGIEMISFLFIVFGIFLPILDLSLLIVCFNLLIVAIYGFGNWWFAYWIIWPFDAFVAKGLSKITRNRFVFSGIGFILGAFVGVWYFFSDLLFFDFSYATLNIITAIPVNVIEGLSTMLLIIFLAPTLLKVMDQWSHKFWNNKKSYIFKEVRWSKIGYFINALVALSGIAGIVILFVYNSFFIDWKSRESRNYYNQGHIAENYKMPDGYNILTPSKYNSFYDSLGKDEIGIAVIALDKIYTEKIKIHNDESLKKAMDDGKKIHFKFHDATQYGSWVQTFKLDSDPSWRHGTSKTTNYGDVYPMYFINHKFATLGVSNYKVGARDIYEFTYDHNS